MVVFKAFSQENFSSRGHLACAVFQMTNGYSAVGSTAGAVPDRCVEEGAEIEGKAFDLPVDLPSNPHMCSLRWVGTERQQG